MSMPTSAATSAYQAAQKLFDSVSSGGNQSSSGSVASAGGSFQDFLAQNVQDLTQSGRNVEAQTSAAIQGKGDMIDVVTAIAETEVALQSMVALRDKVISSYEEIMRMPI